MDFTNLNIHGKYRKIDIDKRTRDITIEKNAAFDDYNLDFPIKYKNKVILRNIRNNTINGFVICENLNIMKTIMLDNRYVCGEPVIVEIEEILTAISILINLTDEEYQDNVDAYFDKFSDYLYIDSGFKD
jgi:hypothetical protein